MNKQCCNGECEQGRRCPARYPAEACTDIGQDDPPEQPTCWKTDLFVAAVCVALTAVALVLTL